MLIGIIDADLIGRKKHNFPNLACMKISGWHKEQGDEVKLLFSYKDLDNYNQIYISKVFLDTPIDNSILDKSNVVYGGTGFYYDKAPPLPYHIEHHMPDYHLYDEYVKLQIAKGVKRSDLKYYLDYSIGFTTRGCFRKCGFCVNCNYDKVSIHSAIDEFLDKDRPKICLLDDNVFGTSKWADVFDALQKTNKPFQFKQGLDERLLTRKKIQSLCQSKYDGDYIFAFDNIEDYDLIESKLRLLRESTTHKARFYVLCGYDKNQKYDENFWRKDMEDLFIRISLLMKYKCYPYIMRYNNCESSPWSGFYTTISCWCNQPNFFYKFSIREFVEMTQLRVKSKCINVKRIEQIEFDMPNLAKKYFNMKFST